MKYLITFIFILLSILSLHVVKVRAQQVSISLSPSYHGLVARPDQDINLHYIIVNNGDPTTGTLKIEPLNSEQPSPITFSFDKEDDSKTFFFRDGEKKNIKLTIHIPVNTQLRDHYFNFIFESTAPPSDEGKPTVRVATRLISPILISMTESGIVTSDIRIQTLYIKPDITLPLFGPIIIQSSKRNILLQLLNKGANFTKVSGIMHLSGLGVDKNIMIPSQIILGEGTINSTIPIPQLFFGVYRLSLELQTSQGNKIVSAQPLYVFPIIYIGLFVALIITSVFFLKRAYDARLSHRVV